MEKKFTRIANKSVESDFIAAKHRTLKRTTKPKLKHIKFYKSFFFFLSPRVVSVIFFFQPTYTFVVMVNELIEKQKYESENYIFWMCTLKK